MNSKDTCTYSALVAYNSRGSAYKDATESCTMHKCIVSVSINALLAAGLLRTITLAWKMWYYWTACIPFCLYPWCNTCLESWIMCIDQQLWKQVRHTWGSILILLEVILHSAIKGGKCQRLIEKKISLTQKIQRYIYVQNVVTGNSHNDLST